jgi:hypothetical protein
LARRSGSCGFQRLEITIRSFGRAATASG